MKRLIGPYLAGILTPFLLLGVIAFLGLLPAGTHDRSFPFEKRIAHFALRRAIGKESQRQSPFPLSETHLLAGAKVYYNSCAGCHGVFGVTTRGPITEGMFPPPPGLLPPNDGVTDDPIGETFWKVAHGIRLTGMPAFQGFLTDTEIWEVSLLMTHADQLPPSVRVKLTPIARTP